MCGRVVQWIRKELSMSVKRIVKAMVAGCAVIVAINARLLRLKK